MNRVLKVCVYKIYSDGTPNLIKVFASKDSKDLRHELIDLYIPKNCFYISEKDDFLECKEDKLEVGLKGGFGRAIKMEIVLSEVNVKYEDKNK